MEGTWMAFELIEVTNVKLLLILSRQEDSGTVSRLQPLLQQRRMDFFWFFLKHVKENLF